MRPAMLGAAAALAATASARAQTPVTARPRPPLDVTSAWVHAPANPDAAVAGYLTIWNNTTDAWVVTEVTCEGVADIALHESREDAGTAHMAPLERLDIPARTTLRMRPGGVHLMLTGHGLSPGRRAVRLGVPCAMSTEPRAAQPVGRARQPVRIVRFHLSVRADEPR